MIDPQAMVAPLLQACPGSKGVAACRRCKQVIEGLAAFDERGFFIHPDECPPPPIPEGQLL